MREIHQYQRDVDNAVEHTIQNQIKAAQAKIAENMGMGSANVQAVRVDGRPVGGHLDPLVASGSRVTVEEEDADPDPQIKQGQEQKQDGAPQGAGYGQPPEPGTTPSRKRRIVDDGSADASRRPGVQRDPARERENAAKDAEIERLQQEQKQLEQQYQMAFANLQDQLHGGNQSRKETQAAMEQLRAEQEENLREIAEQILLMQERHHNRASQQQMEAEKRHQQELAQREQQYKQREAAAQQEMRKHAEHFQQQTEQIQARDREAQEREQALRDQLRETEAAARATHGQQAADLERAANDLRRRQQEAQEQRQRFQQQQDAAQRENQMYRQQMQAQMDRHRAEMDELRRDRANDERNDVDMDGAAAGAGAGAGGGEGLRKPEDYKGGVPLDHPQRDPRKTRLGPSSNDDNYLDEYRDVAHDDGGDYFTHNPTHITATDTMRPTYGMASANDVIPSVQDQMASDIRFDMFSQVPDGFGEGQDNKLFLMEQNREAKIRYMAPLDYVGSNIGPIAGVTVPPWQWQRVMKPSQTAQFQSRKRRRLSDAVLTLENNGASSLALTGYDRGFPYKRSCSGLPRESDSPLEPVIRTDLNWEHVKDPTGVQLNKKQFRLETDAQRMPRQLASSAPLMGGPTLSKRRGLEVILP